MPTRFLSDAQRDRRTNWPDALTFEEFAAYFTLTQRDCTFLKTFRPINRLGTALQLVALRALGFVPKALHDVPEDALVWLADQLKIQPRLSSYGARSQTRTQHLRAVSRYLGFKKPKAKDLDKLQVWLGRRAFEHDRPSLLVDLALQQMKRRKWIRPALPRIEAMVAKARRKAQERTYAALRRALTKARKKHLDQLLEADIALGGLTRLTWLRTGAHAAKSAAILQELEKLEYLKGLGVETWDIHTIHPNRRKHLTQIGRKSTSQALSRMPPQRRYSILFVFVRETLTDLLDEVIDLFDRALALTWRKAERTFESMKLQIAKDAPLQADLLARIAKIILDQKLSDQDVRKTILQLVPKSDLERLVDKAQELCLPESTRCFEMLGRFWVVLRRFTPAFLKACSFEVGHKSAKVLMEAIESLRKMDVNPADVDLQQLPVKFVPKLWKAFVKPDNGSISRKYFELCTLYQLRSALRSGDVWLEGARRYTHPNALLISDANWPKQRKEFQSLVECLEDPKARLEQMRKTMDERLAELDKALETNDQVLIEDGRARISPLEAETLTKAEEALSTQVQARLPRIDLVDLLIEVDQWTGFSSCFEHAAGAHPRSDDHQRHLYAAILAQACNIGQAGMSQASKGIRPAQLAWVTTWYLREETLQKAVNVLVNRHHREPLSRVWGSGILSSSDGQRFPVRGHAANAVANPKYYGLGRGLTFYTWTSNQHSQPGTRVTPTTVRDSTYVQQGRIIDAWDDLVRAAGSLKLGHVTASLLISRLQAKPRKSPLTRALVEYGRAVKTLFVLRWLTNKSYRRRICRQLNKGESLHALRRFLFFAHEGRILRRSNEEQINQASCLNLVTNAVILWNTVYMGAAIYTLKSEGLLDENTDLSHLSPGSYGHLNPYGRYTFNIEAVKARSGLNPLREAQIWT